MGNKSADKLVNLFNLLLFCFLGAVIGLGISVYGVAAFYGTEWHIVFIPIGFLTGAGAGIGIYFWYSKQSKKNNKNDAI